MIQMDYINFAAILLKVVTLTVIFTNVLPKAYREVKVKDGIVFMRKAIFALLCLIFLIQIILLSVGIARIFGFANTEVFSDVSLFNTISMLVVAVIFSAMYSRSYKDN